MAIQKKYYNPFDNSELLIVQWEKGFNNVIVSSNDSVVYSAETLNELRTNSNFVLPEGSKSNIQLKISYQPASIDVFFNGYQSENNAKHPKKEVKKLAFIFWLLAVSVVIISGIEYYFLQNVQELLLISLIVNFISFSGYIVAGILTQKGKSIGFWIGYILFCLRSLIWLLLKFIDPSGILFGGLFRAALIAHLSKNITVILDLRKHENINTNKNTNSEILDANF